MRKMNLCIICPKYLFCKCVIFYTNQLQLLKSVEISIYAQYDD